MQGKAGWSNVPMLWQTLVLGNKMTPVRNSIFKKITMILFIALFTAVYPHSRVVTELWTYLMHIMILLILQTITFYNNQRCSV